jgi:nitroimidazol reductase NimA-like FMN-containing flavoprotein (pyridoxamine 5'-phosphate oxidase superfamily)
MWIRVLSPVECTQVLSDHRIAYLACAKEGRPYVVPIYYAYWDNAIYAFSMPGKKIECMRANAMVSLLVEEKERGREWKSVVIEGRYEELPDRIGHKVERDRCWALLSKHANWWEPGALKPVTPPLSNHSEHIFYRILIDRVSGREAKEGR